MNRINLVGRLLDDVQGNWTQNGNFVAKGAISVPQGVPARDGEKYPPSDIFNFEVWGKAGEALMNHTSKGRHVWIAGSMNSRKDDNGRIWWTVKNAAWGFAGPKPADEHHGGGFDEEMPF